MLKVMTAQTPKLAAEAIIGDVEMSEAAEILANIGLLTMSPGDVSVSPQGEQVLKDLHLIDEMGEPTEEANQLLQQYDVEGSVSEPEQDVIGMDQMPMAGGAPGGMGGAMGDPNAGMSGIPTGESYKALKVLNLL
jgi:hypothetical protein